MPATTVSWERSWSRSRPRFMSRRTKALLWSLATAILVVSGITFAVIHSGTRIEREDCTIELAPGAVLALFVGSAAVGVLAYALFVMARPRPLRGTGWRYTVGVPVAFMAAAAVLVAGYLVFATRQAC